MSRSSLCDYSDAYIFVSGTITVAALSAGGENNKIQVVFKNCAPFTNFLSERNNAQIDNTKDMDVVTPMYNLIEYSNNYSKTSDGLWQYYRDEPALTDDDALDNFPGNSALFKHKQKIKDSTQDDGTKNIEKMVPLKYLSNFWRTTVMPLINSQINLILTGSAKCVISNAGAYQATTFVITNTKFYVPVVILWTQDNAKLLEQLKSGFKSTINWNKFVMIDGKNVFDQPIKSYIKTFENIQKITSGQGNDYRTVFFLRL